VAEAEEWKKIATKFETKAQVEKIKIALLSFCLSLHSSVFNSLLFASLSFTFFLLPSYFIAWSSLTLSAAATRSEHYTKL
jgi:hypothetical protein